MSIQSSETGLRYLAEMLNTALANLECAICTNAFQDPRVLPCGHTFCAACIRTLLGAKDTARCATCQKDFTVPQRDLTKLPKNFALVSVVDSTTAVASSAAVAIATQRLRNGSL